MTRHIGRRLFLKSGAAATLAATTGGAAASDKRRPQPKPLMEPEREVPVVSTADVVVCGGGPAGVTAAIAAARAGANTQLIEVNGCLGGVWTAGLLSWILDAGNKPGIMQEMISRLRSREATAPYGGSVGYDVEQMKILLEEMCLEAGVKIRLHSRVVSSAKDETGRLSLAVTESKSGRAAFGGRVFVDASGDGDLAARAGCHFEYGHPDTGNAQPMSMIVLMAGLDADQVAPFVRGLAEPRSLGSPKANLLEEMRRAGVDPSYSKPTMFYIRDGLFCMMANHEYGVCGMNAGEVTEATLRGRAEVHKLVNALRKLGGPWKEAQIIATAEHIGVREGRRVVGHYMVSTKDLAEGARHEDAVCRCAFPVDVHSTDPTKDKGIPSQGVRAQPYDIPYRALIAKDVDGLLLAGRCISGDFIAHSSYRVTGDAVAMGEAAGVAAALAAQTKRLPQDVPWTEIAGKLEELRGARSSS
jgi:hypothetical protein